MGMLSALLRLPVVPVIFKRIFSYPGHPAKVAGLSFPNLVGLAAGFDKDARWLHALQYLGFGHVEIGTITPLPQAGNPKPRLFRLKKDHALINRMGFNNGGVEAAVKRLKKRPQGLIVGGNIGKNKMTPNEEAWKDYERCFEAMYEYVDYFTINVSSPNTPGLRELQEKDSLALIIGKLQDIRRQKMQDGNERKAIFLKIAPDLNDVQLQDIGNLAKETQLDGLIATNTTISREGLQSEREYVENIGAGGLSGQPLKERSNEVIRQLRQLLGPEFPLIGVGGIMKPDDARDKIQAGADLVQVYSGFIYYGPKLASDISRLL